MSGERLSPEQAARVERSRPQVDRLARGMAKRLARVGVEELRSVGYEALVRCALRYDPAAGASFRTFMFHRVRGAMIDEARRAVPGLRRRSRALRQLQATQALLEERERAGTGPDPRTLQQRVAAAAELVAQATAAVIVSREAPEDPDALVDDEHAEPAQAVDDARERARVRAVLRARCSDDERVVLAAIYDEGLSMTELAERLGVSKSTVSRRHAALLRRLAEAFREHGYAPPTA